MKPASYYDIIVVGGGPVGCMAALATAREDVSVLLLEKNREIGAPVRCAEAIGKEGMENILEGPVDPKWITAEITAFKFVAPDNTEIFPRVSLTGYVLDRRIFDSAIGHLAAQAGAHLITGAYVDALIMEGKTVCGVSCSIGESRYEINSKIVIGADGVESRIGRWAGINTTLRPADIETCSQYTLSDNSIEDKTCVFYFSQDKFPGGYAWIFPKGNKKANVGLGLSGRAARHKPPQHCLDEFIAERFPTASVLSRTIGGVPSANRIPGMTGEGILLVGDAAWQSNPLTGGGITTGMMAAKIGGKIAADAVKQSKTNAAFLKKYEVAWDKAGGNMHRRYYRLKQGVQKLTDRQFNDTARHLKKIPAEKHTLAKIFTVALAKKPSLLVDIIKVINPFS